MQDEQNDRATPRAMMAAPESPESGVVIVDPEIRAAFAQILRQQAQSDADAKARHNALVEVVENKRRDDDKRFSVIESALFGSNPPPAPPKDGGAAPAPIVRQVSEHGGEVAQLAGSLIRVESKTDQALVLVTELAKKKGVALDVANPETPEPSRFEKFKAWLYSPESRVFALRLGTLAAAMYLSYQAYMKDHAPPVAAQPAASSTHASNGGTVSP